MACKTTFGWVRGRSRGTGCLSEPVSVMEAGVGQSDLQSVGPRVRDVRRQEKAWARPSGIDDPESANDVLTLPARGHAVAPPARDAASAADAADGRLNSPTGLHAISRRSGQRCRCPRAWDLLKDRSAFDLLLHRVLETV